MKRRANDGGTPLSGQRNIGPTIARRLAEVGIRSIEALRAVGAAAAYRRLRTRDPVATLPVCYYLYSLQGALDDVRWDALPASTKTRLRADAGVVRFDGRP